MAAVLLNANTATDITANMLFLMILFIAASPVSGFDLTAYGLTVFDYDNSLHQPRISHKRHD